MAHVIERARTGRAKCRGCGKAIGAGQLRFGHRLPNPFADDGGEMTHWFHVPCAAYMRPEAFLETLPGATESIDHRDDLERAARLGVEHRRLPRATSVERASSGRAACRSCREPIEKSTWRIALMYDEDGRFMPSGFIHLGCAAEYLETTDVLDRLRHFSAELTPDEWGEIGTALQESARAVAAPPRADS